MPYEVEERLLESIHRCVESHNQCYIILEIWEHFDVIMLPVFDTIKHLLDIPLAILFVVLNVKNFGILIDYAEDIKSQQCANTFLTSAAIIAFF